MLSRAVADIQMATVTRSIVTLAEDIWRCFTGRCILQAEPGHWIIHEACHGPNGVIDHKLECSDSWITFALDLCNDAIKDMQDSNRLISAVSSLIFGLLLVICIVMQSVMRKYRVLGWFLGAIVYYWAV